MSGFSSGLVLLALCAGAAYGGYARPVSQQWPWVSYTTEPSAGGGSRERADPYQGIGGSLERDSSLDQVIVRSGIPAAPQLPTTSSSSSSTGGSTVRCGHYFASSCRAAQQRRQMEANLARANQRPHGGDSLETAASERRGFFYFGGNGGEDRRIYGSKPGSYSGHSHFFDHLNGQEFHSRSYIPPHIILTPHGPILFQILRQVQPLIPLCGSCQNSRGKDEREGPDGLTTVRPRGTTDKPKTWTPAIYRTSSTESAFARGPPTTTEVTTRTSTKTSTTSDEAEFGVTSEEVGQTTEKSSTSSAEEDLGVVKGQVEQTTDAIIGSGGGSEEVPTTTPAVDYDSKINEY